MSGESAMSLIGIVRWWRESLIGALLIAIGMLWLGRAMTEQQNDKLKTALQEANLTIDRERATVVNRTAQARAEDAAHAARVERDQDQVSMEVSDDYQRQVADLRRRYDALRMHTAAAAADRSGGTGTAVPEIPDAASDTDGPAREDGLPPDDALIASEQALRLQALQQWVRGQTEVER
jgi:hypothetical protein